MRQVVLPLPINLGTLCLASTPPSWYSLDMCGPRTYRLGICSTWMEQEIALLVFARHVCNEEVRSQSLAARLLVGQLQCTPRHSVGVEKWTPDGVWIRTQGVGAG